ncbi:hypothetical protein L3Q65_14825 [Amycolatopsis sp. FU40]|uniref:hypothetical protein n=1 Tax=Amycolatopsis sp. FU40 TaxID=2914159 RepID=UPI001F3575DF|nr:hypothetical protein [Amycolatopsis sp. FU40]UKD57944.1 hypothetical protein L3Q65_14825 [Amycolatopsis sp. FU40]
METLLGIYLNDQLAMGLAWRELARRAARNNRGTEFETPLREAASAIAEDVETFRGVMQAVPVRANPVKAGIAIVAERLGRFKPNGRITAYSPLSRFWELEALAMGIEGKKILWTTLWDSANLGKRLADVDFDALLLRADRQRSLLEPARVRAAEEAFTRRS